MTPRDTSVEQAPVPRQSSTADTVVTLPCWVRTGAQLGWWRALLGLVAVALGCRYVWWQIAMTPSTVLGRVFAAAEVTALLMFAFTLGTLLDRGRRRLPGPASGTLDVFVTVCGEPVGVVETTLRAVLDVDYPHRTFVLNDGRISGKPGWDEIDRLGARLGFRVLTRTTGVRGKAANLNHGLHHSTADFVATIDADHRVDRDLGERMLGHFADPQVAFVTAAQRFDPSTAVLNNRQDFFYRWLQPAKDAAGCAISCGSGVVYRRAALDEIGGFSEWNIVEDLHTSYRLNAAGWISVYERKPVTTGLAPNTAAEYAHQRARWALDSLRVACFDNPLLRRGLSARARLHYLHTTGVYLLALPMLVFLVGPSLYLLLRISVAGSSSVGEYLAHAVPYLTGLTLFFASLVGFRGAIATFRTTLFDCTTTFVALVRAALGIKPSGVSRKDRERRASVLLLPQIVAAAALVVALAVALTDDRPGASPIAVGWAGVNALLLIGPLTAVTERPATARRVAIGTHALVGALAVGSLVVVGSAGPGRFANAPVADPRARVPEQFAVSDAAVATTFPEIHRPTATEGPPTAAPNASEIVIPDVTESPLRPPDAPPMKVIAPATGTYLGAAAEGLHSTREGVDLWSASHGGARPQIVHWFQQWGSGENRFREDWLRGVADQGAIPMISWEPWAKPDGEYAAPTQSDFHLERILAGEFDTYIRAWADGAAHYGGPILLRLMHEFNGIWYPWSLGLQEQTAEHFVAVWRRIHGIFVEAGATNVSWIWSVIGGFTDPQPAYPGDDVVDWVAVTILNAGAHETDDWLDYRSLSVEVYDQLTEYGKPIMLSEVATHDGDGESAAWVDGMLSTIETQQPRVGAVVFFDMRYDEDLDYRLTTAAADVLSARSSSGWFAPDLALAPP